MPVWEEQLRMLDYHESTVLCYVDSTGSIIGEITRMLFSEKPDSRQVTVRQATHRKSPRTTESSVISQINNTVAQLNLGNVLGTTFNGCVFPNGSAPISTGNFLSEDDAIHSVETWWAYWLKDVH